MSPNEPEPCIVLISSWLTSVIIEVSVTNDGCGGCEYAAGLAARVEDVEEEEEEEEEELDDGFQQSGESEDTPTQQQ